MPTYNCVGTYIEEVSEYEHYGRTIEFKVEATNPETAVDAAQVRLAQLVKWPAGVRLGLSEMTIDLPSLISSFEQANAYVETLYPDARVVEMQPISFDPLTFRAIVKYVPR